MKVHTPKTSFFLAAVICMFAMMQPAHAVTGKSFLMPRPTNQDAVLMHSLTHNFVSNTEIKNPLALSATVFYEQSTNAKGLARYFFPNNKTELTIRTDVTAGPTDIWAGDLNIIGKDDPVTHDQLPFSSKIKIRPERKHFGFVLQGLKKFELFKRFFLQVDVPFVQVEHNVNFTEFDVVNAAQNHQGLPSLLGGATDARLDFLIVTNATEAFNGPALHHAKIKDGTQKLAGIADINLKIGYEALRGASGYLQLFTNFIIPMGYEPKAEFLFEPLIGNGRHFGLGVGLEGDILIRKKDRFDITLFGMLDVNYLFEDGELRTFDLKSRGPWSRYILVTDPDFLNLSQFFPAADYLTLRAKITPRVVFNFMTQLACNFHAFDINFGYNLWARSSEKVALKGEPKEGLNIDDNALSIAIPHLGGVAAFNTPLTKDDINLDSAKNPEVVKHTLFSDVRIHGCFHDNPMMYRFGAKYTLSQSNRSTDEWGLFMSCNILV